MGLHKPKVDHLKYLFDSIAYAKIQEEKRTFEEVSQEVK
jgi:hypothetical protein